MDVEIQTRGIELLPELRAIVAERLVELERRYPELLRVHVTLKREGHHQQGNDEVDVVGVCTGGTVRAAKQKEGVRDALHAALDAFQRQLEDHHDRRRRRPASLPERETT
jgi:ribosomal subunit interface protein